MNYKTYRFESIPSTQDFLREKRALGENAVAIARSQSGGKGTKGRSFESKEENPFRENTLVRVELKFCSFISCGIS